MDNGGRCEDGTAAGLSGIVSLGAGAGAGAAHFPKLGGLSEPPNGRGGEGIDQEEPCSEAAANLEDPPCEGAGGVLGDAFGRSHFAIAGGLAAVG